MTFITGLIGGSENTWLTALFALGIVVVLIVLGVWLLRLVLNASTSVTRGRNRRLAVVDTLALDPKRQLLIIRRDDVEHLILVGGPQDLVVEASIPTEEEGRATQPSRRPIPLTATRKPAPPTTAKPIAGAPTVVIPAEQDRPTNQRAHLSLRHTGLLRPVNEREPPVSPENSGARAAVGLDSVKEDKAQRDTKGTNLVKGNTETNRN